MVFGHRELFAWALPRLGLDPLSFERLGKQVRKRIGRRVAELGLGDLAAYRAYLESHPEEWRELDARCFVTISRFFRDGQVFELLERVALPELAAGAEAEGRHELSIWSAGAAGGEEAYSLALLWRFRLAPRHPALELSVLGTELDPVSLARAAARRYPPGCLREVPADIRQAAFGRAAAELELHAEHARAVRFERGDLRRELPPGPFDLISCRNVAFTYFDAAARMKLLPRLLERLRPRGYLLLGRREDLPRSETRLAELDPGSRLYRFCPEA
ncbi:MAG: chemotaxis protein CheR [Myxococcales bacterium]|nr:chemotaxis protein CheR [Myxococcales bacterium]